METPSLSQFFGRDSGPVPPQPKGRPETVGVEMDVKSVLKRLTDILAMVPQATDKPVRQEVKNVGQEASKTAGQVSKVNTTLGLSREDDNRNALMLRSLLERNHKQNLSQLRAIERAIRAMSAGSTNVNLGGLPFPRLPTRLGGGGGGSGGRGGRKPPATALPPMGGKEEKPKPGKPSKTSVPEAPSREAGWRKNADGSMSKSDGKLTTTYERNANTGEWEKRSTALDKTSVERPGAKPSGSSGGGKPQGPMPRTTAPEVVTETRNLGFFEGAWRNVKGEGLVRAGDAWVDPKTKLPATVTTTVARDVSGAAAQAAKPSLLGRIGGGVGKVAGKIPILNTIMAGAGAYDAYSNAGDYLGMDEDQMTEGNKRAAAVGGALNTFDPLQLVSLGSMASNALFGTNFDEDMSIGKTIFGARNNMDLANTLAVKAGLVDGPTSAQAQAQKEASKELDKKLTALTKAVEESTDATEGLGKELEAAGLHTFGAEQEAANEMRKGPLMELFSNMIDVLSGRKTMPDAAGGPGAAPSLGSSSASSSLLPIATTAAVAGGAAAAVAPRGARGKVGLLAGIGGATLAGVSTMMTPSQPTGNATANKRVAAGTGILQKNPELAQTIIDAALERGEDPAVMLAIADKESTFNPSAKASTSSAKGLYQFLDGTWDTEAKKAGMAGANPLDPKASAKVGANFLAGNRAALEKSLGRKVGAREIYAAHFLGQEGAKKFYAALDQNPNAIGAEVFPKAAAANKTIYYDKTGRAKTLAEIDRDLFQTTDAAAQGYAAALAQGQIPGAEKTAYYAQANQQPAIQTASARQAQPETSSASASSAPPAAVTMAGQRAEAKTPTVIVQSPAAEPQKPPMAPPPVATTAVAAQPATGSIPLVFTDADILYGA